MPLGKLNRDIAFFQDLRDTNSLINAVDYDDQFNQIIDFINDEMIPVVDAIVGGAVPGVIGSPNTFLHNIGDGNTDFVAINNAAIPDFVLEFSKLAKSVNNCAILATDNTQEFVEVYTANSDLILVSGYADKPGWAKINAGNIEDRTITADKIALNTIKAENMVPGTLINNLPNNSIIGANFADEAVTNAKIARNSLEIRNFGVVWPAGINNAVFDGQFYSKHIVPGTLSGEKIKDAIVNTWHFNLVKCIAPGKIAPQTITNAFLEQLGWNNPPNVARGYFPSYALSPNFKLTNTQLRLDYFIKTMFEPTAEAAFTSHGC